MRKYAGAAVLLLLFVMTAPAHAQEIVVPMNLLTDQGIGKDIGTVTISQGPQGLIFDPDLTGLSPGEHGFHVHENPDCSPKAKEGKMKAGLAAGGHYDPLNTGRHEGPRGAGHLGDLPVLTVNAAGKAETPVVAPRLRMKDVQGRSLIIHAGGDNYSDQPAPLGGGGDRVVCGIIR